MTSRFEVFPEEYYDEGKVRRLMTVKAEETLDAWRRSPELDKNTHYTTNQLWEVLCGENGVLKRTKFGNNGLSQDLHVLWRCRRISKYAKGIYIRSKRPYGISWRLKFEGS